LQEGKLRPALILAFPPGRHEDVLLALVTSRVHQVIPDFDEVIQPFDADFAASGLKVASTVRLARLTSVEPAIIVARLGEIAPERLKAIKQRLIDWLKK
jgi:mRNA interferase MazF